MLVSCRGAGFAAGSAVWCSLGPAKGFGRESRVLMGCCSALSVLECMYWEYGGAAGAECRTWDKEIRIKKKLKNGVGTRPFIGTPH